MFDLSGMTALVTGASGGLGSAIAEALAGEGARLAVSGSNIEKLESFRTILGGDHVALPCNLSDGAAVDQLVPQAVEALGGKLDILVNNAGITRDNLLMRMKDEEFEDVIRINLEAAFRLMRAAAKPMIKQIVRGPIHLTNLSRGVMVVILLGFVTHLLPKKLHDRMRETFIALPAPAQGGLLFGVALVIREVATTQVVPFVYFQF
jgi:NAD(P)-dependent dehydrogenase (short-subunit alcohol dehydrogenase family)